MTTSSTPSSWGTDGRFVADFIETFCRTSKGRHAGAPLRLRDWQHHLLEDLYAYGPDGRRRHRKALVGMPRKNGKSALGSGLALFGLLADGEAGAEVYSVAGDKEQARIVFGEAKRMVSAEPELLEQVRLFKDAIEVPATQSVYRVLSSVAELKEGLNPSLTVFDELHVQGDPELWNVMTLGSGTRYQPLTVAITTAGVTVDRRGQDSVAYTLYQHGQALAAGEVEDPSFFFRWWSPADPGADHRDPATWFEANPALGDFLDEADFHSALADPTLSEGEFRTKRCNLFVAGRDSWLPYGAWDLCADPDRAVPDDDEPVVLGFDGSFSGDSTALIGCTVTGSHLFVVDAWERPVGGGDWRVPVAEVEERIRAVCRDRQVLEVACDPYRWQHSMGVLESEGLPLTEWNTNSVARMVPACTSFRAAVLERTLSHDGDVRLARHVGNAQVLVGHLGPRIVKEHKDSQRRIDLAVAAVIAYDRARWHATQSETTSVYEERGPVVL